MNNLEINKEYEGTVFTILQNNINEDLKSYYLFTFDISEKGKKSYKTINIIIGCAVAFIVIIVIVIIIITYVKKSKQKNKNLREKVNAISFTFEKDDDEEP